MKFKDWLLEMTIDKIEAKEIRKILDNLPSTSPDGIAKYIVNAFEKANIEPIPENATYISGPMTNLPDDNWPAFIHAEKYLSGKVYSPAHPHGTLLKIPKETFKWHDYMTEDMYGLLKSNKMVLMPGYSGSSGAKSEIAIAKKLMGIEGKELKKVIGEKKYQQFVKDVEKQYIKDNNEKSFREVIEPMLLAKTETEAAKIVRPFKS